MADISTLARPYAKAVFELARDSGKLKDWSAQLAALAGAVANSQLAALISNPALSRPQLAALFGEALGKSLGAEAQTLLRILVENGRLKAAASIAEQYEALRAEAETRADVEITTAVAVDKPQQDQLTGAIKKRLAREVTIDWKIDESLMAGALIRAGDLVIDGSVRGELEKLHTALAR